MKSDTKINYYLSNLNVANIIIGYTFTVSLIMPLIGNAEGASRIVTVPYRGLSLLLSLLVLFLNIKSNVKLSTPIKLFFLFWVAVLVRMFYDLEVRTDYYVLAVYKQKVWLMALAGCFISMISLYKSIKIIDFNYCFKLLYIGCIIIMIPSFLFSLTDTNESQRAAGNAALDAISFGSIGITMSLLCVYKIVNSKKKYFFKCSFNFILAALGLYIALRTGSRGPILGFVLILFFWYAYTKKNGTITFSFFLLAIYIFRFLFVKVLAFLSPLTAIRVNEALSGQDMSMNAREESYTWFLERIYNYPLIGSQFARLGNGHYPGYAHSIILDILLGFGIIGLFVFAYVVIKTFKSFTKSLTIKNNQWVGLIMMQYFLLALTSGAYYSNPILNCTIILTLLVSVKKRYI